MMIRISPEQFQNLILDLYDYMGREKRPPQARINLWYNKVSKISSEYIKKSFDHMKDNLDSIPHNLPKAIKKAVFEINRSKSAENFKFINYGNCDDCGGIGMYKTRICTPGGQWIEPIYFCSQCENWRNWANDPEPSISKSELKAMNILFKPYNKVFKYVGKYKPKGNIKDVANFVGSKMAINKNINQDRVIPQED
jgi:hypothetical protein